MLAEFPECLKESQRIPNNLKYLGELCKTPHANIVKLPNISASIPQLQACIHELRDKGYDVPLYPNEPQNEQEVKIQQRYNTILGSAVNPVLREGNSDRRVAHPVKQYAQKNPHPMGMWSKASRTHVAHMDCGDFYESELSYTNGDAPTEVSIVHLDEHGGETILKPSISLEPSEVIDASRMSIKELTAFYEREIEEAKETDILVSLVSSK